MRTPLITLAAAVSLATAWHSTAMACRHLVPRGLENYEQVAVVKVVSAEAEPNLSFHLWRISATLDRAIKGAPPKTFAFTGVVGSNGCESSQPMPGDQWVVYSGGDGAPAEFPLARVINHDPRLAPSGH